jgi:hypothetical protein
LAQLGCFFAGFCANLQQPQSHLQNGFRGLLMTGIGL